MNLKNVTAWSSGWYILDGANAETTFTFIHKLRENLGGYGQAFGSFSAWITVDTLKDASSAKDSLQTWWKEIKSYTSSSSYITSAYDSTYFGTLDWTGTTDDWKLYTIASDVNLGIEFRVKHTTTVDDCVKVKIDLLYQ